MKCKILHESRNRIRVHLMMNRMTLEQADILEYYFRSQAGITDVKVFDRTCDVIVWYSCERRKVLNLFAKFACSPENKALVPEHTGRELTRTYQEKLAWTIFGRILQKTVLPSSVRVLLTMGQSLKYIQEGLRTLLKGKIEVSVLDATAITVAVLRGDTDTASSVMFLLKIGEILEEWTHRKAVDDLAGTLSLNIEKVWLRTETQEILVPVSEIQKGDTVVIRTGSVIPLDGRVISGDAEVNQSSMTGESMPVHKSEDVLRLCRNRCRGWRMSG